MTYGVRAGIKSMCEESWINMNKVAILYICTGKYYVFWKDFYESFEKFFLLNSDKHYYVFTDKKRIYKEESVNVHKIMQKSLGWPDNTLMRFSMFLRIENELKDYNYVFFMNANCICVNRVLEADFLPVGQNLLVVKHPGFYSKDNDEFDYDRNIMSTAYIEKGRGEFYVCGGVNGGTPEGFLKMAQELNSNILLDKSKKVIAKWHDESHLNRYILDRTDFKILSPSYCYPENWNLPFEPIIMVRDKSNWISVDKVKQSFWTRMKMQIKRLKKCINK